MVDARFSIDLVYLIDDSSIDNFINQKMIEQNVFLKQVKAFTKAIEALKCLFDLDENKASKNQIPSIIFLDLNMPLINGGRFLELFNKLSHFIKSRCKIVILTTSLNPKDEQSASNDSNIIVFFNKPLISTNFSVLNTLLEEDYKRKE